MTGVKRTFYGRVRALAFGLWTGPEFIEKQSEDSFLGGWCILRLAMRKEAPATARIRHQMEARAIYVLLHDEAQPYAILRAVYWDSQTVVYPYPPATAPVKIPASFVQVPVSTIRQWVDAFDGLQTSIQAFPDQQYDDMPVCSLRVATERTSNMFEKVWPVVDGKDSGINSVWQDVWRQMGEALQTCPAVIDVEESFPDFVPEPDSYDFPAYQPSLTLP